MCLTLCSTRTASPPVNLGVRPYKYMHALFVHGMGRTPLSGLPLLWQLRRAGIKTGTFGYFAGAESFSRISERLAVKVVALAARNDYVLIGHSLGGVLIRAVVNSLPSGTRQPSHVFLLGSPIQASRLAQRLQNNLAYRLLTRDCGQLLGSSSRMSEVSRISVPTTSIVGVRGLGARGGPFRGELNDGIVSVSEASAEWLTEQVQIPCVHTLLPASRSVGKVILERLAR